MIVIFDNSYFQNLKKKPQQIWFRLRYGLLWPEGRKDFNFLNFFYRKEQVRHKRKVQITFKYFSVIE